MSDFEKKEKTFLNSLSRTKKRKIMEKESLLLEEKEKIPLRYKILNGKISDSTKRYLLEKLNSFSEMSTDSSEYHKLKKFFGIVEKIPFGVYRGLSIKKLKNFDQKRKFLSRCKDCLDKSIYGQEKAKSSLLEIISKKISNPCGNGNVIGLIGPPGTGKTSLIKDGLADGLGVPFGFVKLGGSNTPGQIEGFDYTWEGSRWGKIIDIITRANCFDPVIYFDELDKISETKSGEDISSILTHLTDFSQNQTWEDKYLTGVEIDLSKAVFIFSLNDKNRIPPALKNRITFVKMEPLTIFDKINISENFLLPKICERVGFDKKNIIVGNETIKSIIEKYSTDQGMRKVEQALEKIIMKINYLDMIKLGEENLKQFLPYQISPETALEMIDEIL